MHVEQLIDALSAKRTGPGQWHAICPAHPDHNTPSLAIRVKDGKTLLYCHAGCDQATLIAVLKERGIWSNGATPKMGDTLEAEYTYRDESGKPVGIKRRYRSGDGKTFKWVAPGCENCKGLSEHGLKVEDMPLYGIESLLEGFAILVEGEKAAEACRLRELPALCNPGGSGQKEFGTALDALRGKSVVLWPDNDVPGRELMRRIAGKLTGIAKNVRFIAPKLPDKGDAYDYFVVQGHTKEEFLELVGNVRTKPWMEEEVSGYAVHVPESGGVVHFLIDGLDPWQKAHECEITTWAEIPGYADDRFQARLRLQSISGRDAFRRQLEDVIPLGKGVWGRLLNIAIQLVQEAHRNADPSVLLCDVPAAGETKYLIRPWMVDDGPTVLFGMGGSGKTFLALMMAVCLTTGAPFLGTEPYRKGRVLFIDYEASPERTAARLKMIQAGLGIDDERVEGIVYWPGLAPLPDMVPGLQRHLAKNSVDLILVDSAILACGGPPKDPEIAAAYFNALRRLKVPSLTISHVVKDEEGDKYPFGSIVWHNSARLTWNVKVQQEEGENIVHVGLFNRKANDDRKYPSVGLRLEFEEGMFRAVNEDVTQNFAKDVGAKRRILAALNQPQCTRCVADQTGLNGDVVRVRMNELKTRGLVVATMQQCESHRTSRWALREQDAR